MGDEAGRVYVGAYAWCVRDAKLLLARISPEAVPDSAGMWTLPGGGALFGEHPHETVIRELGEETGLTGRCGPILGVYSALYEQSPARPQPSVHFLGLVYAIEGLQGVLRPEVDGTTDHCEWIGLDEVTELALVDLVRWALRALPLP